MRNNDEEVGYGKPPKDTRFKTGQCGNQNGRPRGALSVAKVLNRTLREKVVLNENGRRRTATKLQAALKQLVNKAATGDLSALKMLLTLVRSAEEQSAGESHSGTELSEVDQKIMQDLLERYELNDTKKQEDEGK